MSAGDRPAGDRSGLIARVVTDVAGIDKEFDYLVPAAMAPEVEVGTQVRVPLGPRRVGAWVVGLRPAEPPSGEAAPAPDGGWALRPVAKRRGHGPTADLVDLAGWAAWRWAGKRATFLTAASADAAVVRLPPTRRRPPTAPPPGTARQPPAGPGPHVVRLPPAADPTALVATAAQRGPTLVIVPSTARAAVLAGRLRRAGGDVALLPDDWAAARAGRAVVIGSRAAAWGPCPDLAAVVVLDAHDESLRQEGAPTWAAVTVAVERARRAGVPCWLVSACPTLELLALGPLTVPEPSVERAGWAATEVLDRRLDDPRLGLYSERLVSLVREGAKVACILNRTGRIRLLTCGACGELVRCDRCAAAVGSPDAGTLVCPRCGHSRPGLCLRCGSIALKSLRVGTGRAREDLERLAGRPVGEVSGPVPRGKAGGDHGTADEEVLVGTEALLRRIDPAAGFSTVAFVDFDQELLAPRVRAAEEALALLALASRLVRGRRGRVVVQTRMPEHPVIQAAVAGNPGLAADDQAELRRALGFPPYTAVALVAGDAAGEWVARLAGVQVLGPDDGRWLVKAPDYSVLCDALAAVPRPATGTLRVAVDPPRL